MRRSAMAGVGVLATMAALVSLYPSAMAQQDGYYGIPPGYDFPGDRATLERYRATEDIVAMRLHAWNVWGGINQPTPDGGARWETWYRASETFQIGPQPQGERTIRLEFEPPNQFEAETGPAPQAFGESLLAAVLFNKEAHEFIRAEGLFRETRLAELNNAFPAGTPWNERAIPDFPAAATVLKTVWWPVRGDGMTAMPIWDFEPTRPIEDGNNWDSWARVVAIDPLREVVPPDEYVDISLGGIAFDQSHVVSLRDFYFVEVDAAMAAAANRSMRAAIRAAIGRDLQVGDYAVLAQMHVTTKEIDDWIWATFWWHDRPNSGPYATDRPNAVTGVARNYLMDVAYDAIYPREMDGTPNAVYNPWLEARFQNGPLSNCMTCHQRASYPRVGVDFLPVTRGLPDLANDPMFAPGRLQTDFMWSIVGRAR